MRSMTRRMSSLSGCRSASGRPARNCWIDRYTDFSQALNRRMTGASSTLGALPSITYCSMLSAQRS